MDTQFWIWLIVIVITLIARANKKKPPQPFEPSQPDYRESPPDTTLDKPITFEDLLKEIQAAKVPKPVAPPVKKYDFEDYDDDIKEETEVVERSDYRSEDSIYETYEKAKRDAFSKASLEETLKVEDTVVKFEQQKGYQQVADREATVNEYVKELKNPTSFKKAFILSEILGRRF